MERWYGTWYFFTVFPGMCGDVPREESLRRCLHQSLRRFGACAEPARYVLQKEQHTKKRVPQALRRALSPFRLSLSHSLGHFLLLPSPFVPLPPSLPFPRSLVPYLLPSLPLLLTISIIIIIIIIITVMLATVY